MATRLDDEEGILVTGGVDADNRPLSSVEFYSIDRQEWLSLADLTLPRTEHGIYLVSNAYTASNLSMSCKLCLLLGVTEE